jgi:hypothetical protein
MNFDLFTIESGEFWSQRLQEHLDLRLKLSESGKTGANNRWKNGGAITGAIGEGNAKERKVKEIKRNINLIDDIQTFKSELGDEYDNFVMYWTEPNKNGKLRYELEKFFDIKRRVNTWMQNKNKYGNSKNTDATATSRKRMEDLANWVNRAG